MTLLPGSDGRLVAVVGESHYQRDLRRIVGKIDAGGVIYMTTATLVREPGNRHDKNAVRVEIGDRLVGYLSRDDAARYQQALRELERHKIQAECHARVEGGGKGESLGVFLDLAAPDAIAKPGSGGRCGCPFMVLGVVALTIAVRSAILRVKGR